jgi:8-oxo-dGTP diphosphatase
MNIQEVYNLIIESSQQSFTGAGIILVTKKGKVLILKKANNAWGFPGGKPDEHESPDETAIRETEEETGVRVANLNSKPLKIKYNNRTYYSFIYVLDTKVKISLSTEHKDFQWIFLGELKKKKLIAPFRENIESIILKIKKHLAK